MKKRISSIFLTLILVFTLIGTSVFTSCKDKDGGEKQEVALSEAVETDHADELADILLTVYGNADNSGDATMPSLTKKDYSDLIKMVAGEYKTSLDLIGQKVLYSAGITNAKISASLIALNGFLKDFFTLTKYAKSLSVKYGDLDIYKDGAIIPQPPKYDETLINPEQAYFEALKSYVLAVKDVIDVEKVNALVNKFNQDDKTEFLNKYGAFNASMVKFVETIILKEVTGAVVNFAYNYDNLGLNLSAETTAKLEALKSSLTALKIDTDEKKNAYAELVGFAFEETKKVIVLEKGINASDLVDLLNSISELQNATASEKTAILTKIGNSLHNIIVAEGDVVIAMGNDTLSSSDKIKNACNVLDKNGISYFVNRFLPLYANGQVFAGTLLKNFSKSDLLALLNCRSNGLISDAFVKSEDPNYILTGDEGLYRVAEIICHNLQTALNNLSDKKAFTDAIDLAMGDGGTFSKYFLGLVEKMDGYYTSDYSKNLSFDKLAKADQDAIKQTYSDIIVAVSSIQVAMDGMTEAINSVKNYVQPILNFMKSL